MTDWTGGYTASADYTYGYFPELNPLRMRLALLNAGLAPPEAAVACELGFGQGVSINIHAAGSATIWYGNDFLPAQAGFAQQLATLAGNGACLSDEAFADFCRRDDLPDFDFIALHGIWSWVSAGNRAIIVEFLSRKLKPGGVAYLSYNNPAGWSPMAPVRNLMAQHAEVMSAPGLPVLDKVAAALAFVDRLMRTQPRYAAAQPALDARLAALRGQDRTYIAHEYLNRSWEPMSFADMAGHLAPAGLSFACPATYLEHLDPINLSAPQVELLAGIGDSTLRETARDLMVNQSFRRDYWIKGARRLDAAERAAALRGQCVILSVPRGQVALSVDGALGKIGLNAGLYGAVLDLLGEHRVLTLEQLELALAPRGIGLELILQTIITLCEKGAVAAARAPLEIAAARPSCARLNAALLERARADGLLPYLASPVTGGGVGVARIDQLFLLARARGLASAPAWARFAGDTLAAQGQTLMVDGAPATPAQLADDLARQAERFAALILPVLSALGAA